MRSNQELLEWVENKVDHNILKYYWNTLDDHDDLRKILQAIDSGGQLCDVPNVLTKLHNAGYRIVRIVP